MSPALERSELAELEARLTQIVIDLHECARMCGDSGIAGVLRRLADELYEAAELVRHRARLVFVSKDE